MEVGVLGSHRELAANEAAALDQEANAVMQEVLHASVGLLDRDCGESATQGWWREGILQESSTLNLEQVKEPQRGMGRASVSMTPSVQDCRRAQIWGFLIRDVEKDMAELLPGPTFTRLTQMTGSMTFCDRSSASRGAQTTTVVA